MKLLLTSKKQQTVRNDVKSFSLKTLLQLPDNLTSDSTDDTDERPLITLAQRREWYS